jgi:hypothetical protein
MIRAILFGVMAFLVGLGAATGFVYVQKAGAATDLSGALATGSMDLAATGETMASGLPSVALGAPDGEALDDYTSPGEPISETKTATGAAAAMVESASAEANEPAGIESAGIDTAGTAATDDTRIQAPPNVATMDPEAPLPEPRLGRIFGAMQPREAARVLEQMDDGDIATILGMLNDRQAAAVLANLPPNRAAGISRIGVGVRSER